MRSTSWNTILPSTQPMKSKNTTLSRKVTPFNHAKTFLRFLLVVAFMNTNRQRARRANRNTIKRNTTYSMFELFKSSRRETNDLLNGGFRLPAWALENASATKMRALLIQQTSGCHSHPLRHLYYFCSEFVRKLTSGF